jgi:DUF3016 family protein
MNTISRLNLFWTALISACFLSFAASVLAHDSEAPSRVTVTWAPVDTLSEVKNNQMHRGWLRPEDWMKTLGDYMIRRGDLMLPSNEKLEVTIEDIKLAGDFEPWHSVSAQDIRFMKDIYPPRMSLHYKLISSDGTLIRESENNLLDLAYLQRTVPTNTDPLRYDKRLIDDWLRQEFARAQP